MNTEDLNKWLDQREQLIEKDISIAKDKQLSFWLGALSLIHEIKEWISKNE